MNAQVSLFEAIARAKGGDWEQLDRLAAEAGQRDRERMEALAHLRHEVGNLLSIAQANLEAIVDGIVDGTPERLRNIRDAMARAGEALTAFRDP